ncbi:hypothetical protein COLU111180_15560 [Cohnella lubricantis]|uniref:Phosphodiester glycosidase domain-containing protein n=1 Tax=Cohnella lubricantis TaxID=2163172 RepID=A0A841TI51_9BACL|nr:hypothetical protein [Cohnella lubricantis]MBB6678151.1 hypothetical protein [Cohnella lubricantis]MBP2120635.1 hypothetical protein [Cohnella lubricantis]
MRRISLPNIRIPARPTLAVLAALFFLLCIGSTALLFMNKEPAPAPDPELDMPFDYTYGTALASNGMTIHYLKTRPSNLSLEAVHQNVTLSPFYGVNGGFFYHEDLLSMAVVNDRPANGEAGGYGSGWENAKYARGTLVWDGSADRLSVQVVRQASELDVTDRANYWAQGGISMSLGRDVSWEEQAAAENAPYPYDRRLRSAAVYDREGNVYLVVSSSMGMLADFRAAIVETIAPGSLADGIFLDGDGSSQLRSREMKLRGDSRPVVQMIRIVR